MIYDDGLCCNKLRANEDCVKDKECFVESFYNSKLTNQHSAAQLQLFSIQKIFSAAFVRPEIVLKVERREHLKRNQIEL